MQGTLEPKKIIAGAIVSVLERRGLLARALLVPTAAYLVLELVRQSAAQQSAGLVAIVLQLMAHTLFAVTTHRILLLGAGAVPTWGLLGWSRRESLFLLQVITVSLCLLPVALLVGLPPFGPLLGLGVGVWLVARLSLVFPAAALEQPLTIAQAWRLSGPHQLPLLITLAGFPALLGIPAALLTQVPSNALLVSLVSLVSLVITVFTIAALSLSYSEVVRVSEP